MLFASWTFSLSRATQPRFASTPCSLITLVSIMSGGYYRPLLAWMSVLEVSPKSSGKCRESKTQKSKATELCIVTISRARHLINVLGAMTPREARSWGSRSYSRMAREASKAQFPDDPIPKCFVKDNSSGFFPRKGNHEGPHYQGMYAMNKSSNKSTNFS